VGRLTLGGLTVVGLTVVGLTVVGLTVVGLTVVGLTVVGLTVVGLTVVGLTGGGLTGGGLTGGGLTGGGLTGGGLTGGVIGGGLIDGGLIPPEWAAIMMAARDFHAGSPVTFGGPSLLWLTGVLLFPAASHDGSLLTPGEAGLLPPDNHGGSPFAGLVRASAHRSANATIPPRMFWFTLLLLNAEKP
jgi:hypothetical protein